LRTGEFNNQVTWESHTQSPWGRMKERGSPKLLFENLNLTPMHSILGTGLHTKSPGRPVEYHPEWGLRALMLIRLLHIPCVKDLVKRLRRNPYLRKACGHGDGAPCEAHFTQMKSRIGAEGFRVIEAHFHSEALKIGENQPLTAVELIQATCVDGTGLRGRGAAGTQTMIGRVWRS